MTQLLQNLKTGTITLEDVPHECGVRGCGPLDPRPHRGRRPDPGRGMPLRRPAAVPRWRPAEACMRHRLAPQGDYVLADDSVRATLECENGSRGNTVYSAPGADRIPKELVEVMCDGRSAVLDNFRRFSLYDGAHVSTARGSQDKGHRGQFRTLIQAVAAGGPRRVAVDELLLSSLSTVYIVESLSAGHSHRRRPNGSLRAWRNVRAADC